MWRLSRSGTAATVFTPILTWACANWQGGTLVELMPERDQSAVVCGRVSPAAPVLAGTPTFGGLPAPQATGIIT